MRRFIRFILPLLVLLSGIAVSASLIATAPETERKRPAVSPPTVEAMALKKQDYQIKVLSRGTLSPKTSSTLVAEVAGRIVKVADNFNNGEFFSDADLLVQIDPRDYQNALAIAGLEVSQSKLALAEERARAEQARREWDNLQLQEDPGALVLRTPQQETARAALLAAEARLNQAELELERTGIRAPYAGRILEKTVDVGQYVSPGTPLARIYASDQVEVRLPISNEDLQFIDLPEIFVDKRKPAGGTKVVFSVTIGKQTHQWQGQMVRTEGSVDQLTRQLFVIARIDNPYASHSERPPLKIGQFVTAQLYGQLLKNVLVLPRKAVRGEYTVHQIDADNRLVRRELDIIWRDEQQVVATGPLQEGDRISLTTLPFAADGIKVQVSGEPDAVKDARVAQEPGE